jgi:hypothetical protein
LSSICRNISKFIVYCVVLLMWPHTAFAAEQPELLTGERMYYEKSASILTAVGKVLYRSEDFEFTSDKIRYHTETDELFAEGHNTIRIKNVGAEKKTGTMVADRFYYCKTKKFLRAEGNIILTFDGQELHTDYLEYNDETKTMWARGPVFLKDKNGDSMQGHSYTYNVDTNEGRIDDLTYTFTYDDTKFFSTEDRLAYDDDKTVIDQGIMTTCDLQNPHYHFSMKKAEYYPGKKLVLHDVAYWEGKHKLAEYSTLVIPLRENENGDDEPEVLVSVGYSEDEGAYIKTKQYYDLRASDYGIIYRDYMTRKGLGLGFREHHFLPENEEQDYLLYATQVLDKDFRTAKGEYKISNPYTYSLLSLYGEENNPETGANLFESRWSYSKWEERNQMNWQINYQRQTADSVYSYLSGQFSNDTLLSDRLRTNLNLNFYNSRTSWSEPAKDRTYAISMDYTAPDYFMQLYNYEAQYGYDYSPRLVFKSNFDTPVQFEINTTRLVHNVTDFSVRQNDVKANYNSRPVELVKDTFFTYNVNLLRSEFSTDDALAKWSIYTSLLQNVTPDLYVTTRFNIEKNKGFDPVQQNAGFDTKVADWEANWRINDIYSLAVSGGYDFEQQWYNPLTTRITGTNYPFWNWALSASYDPNEDIGQTMGLNLVFDPRTGITGYVDINYDLQTNTVRDISARTQFILRKGWDISAATHYNTIENRFNVSEFKATRILHCRELALSVYPLEKKYFASYSLKNPSNRQGHVHE